MKSHDAGKRLNNFKRDKHKHTYTLSEQCPAQTWGLTGFQQDYCIVTASMWLREHKQITLINIVKERYVDNKTIKAAIANTEGVRLSLNYKSELYVHTGIG